MNPQEQVEDAATRAFKMCSRPETQAAAIIAAALFEVAAAIRENAAATPH